MVHNLPLEHQTHSLTFFEKTTPIQCHEYFSCLSNANSHAFSEWKWTIGLKIICVHISLFKSQLFNYSHLYNKTVYNYFFEDAHESINHSHSQAHSKHTGEITHVLIGTGHRCCINHGLLLLLKDEWYGPTAKGLLSSGLNTGFKYIMKPTTYCCLRAHREAWDAACCVDSALVHTCLIFSVLRGVRMASWPDLLSVVCPPFIHPDFSGRWCCIWCLGNIISISARGPGGLLLFSAFWPAHVHHSHNTLHPRQPSQPACAACIHQVLITTVSREPPLCPRNGWVAGLG